MSLASSSGAYLGAAASILLGIGSVFGDQGMGIMAFFGALAASFGVLFISGIGGRTSAGKLILAGMAVSTVCSAFANFLIYISQNREATTQISYWSMGSLATADWDNVPVVLPVMIVATLIFWTQSRKLNLMLLGDETAVTLGTDLHRVRIVYLILSSLMVGTAVCAAGMIGFVGLIIPHAVRMCLGTDHKRLVPVSALTGAVFLIWADVACRVILDYAKETADWNFSLSDRRAVLYLSDDKEILWIWRWGSVKINTEDLHLSYGAQEILKGISIQSKEKEFIGLIGPNGSGKSTLLKCIYRTLKPDQGAVYLDGKELSTIRVKDSARKLAVVAQHNHYNFEFTVQEIVMMGRSPHKKALERDNAGDYTIVKEALQAVGMSEFADRSFSTLSGGEQQRVILARALAQQTPCLILDEPTNHLDITHQLQLMRIVKERNVTVISAVHDLNIAAMFCDRIYALKDGRIAGEGTPESLLTPEFIREIYDVEAEVVKDKKGQIHILFVE